MPRRLGDDDGRHLAWLFGCTGATDVLVAAETTTGTPTNFFYVPNRTFYRRRRDGRSFGARLLAGRAARLHVQQRSRRSRSSRSRTRRCPAASSIRATAATRRYDGSRPSSACRRSPARRTSSKPTRTPAMAINTIDKLRPCDVRPTSARDSCEQRPASNDEDMTSHTISWTNAGGVTPDRRDRHVVARTGDERSWAWAMASPRSSPRSSYEQHRRLRPSAWIRRPRRRRAARQDHGWLRCGARGVALARRSHRPHHDGDRHADVRGHLAAAARTHARKHHHATPVPRPTPPLARSVEGDAAPSVVVATRRRRHRCRCANIDDLDAPGIMALARPCDRRSRTAYSGDRSRSGIF